MKRFTLAVAFLSAPALADPLTLQHRFVSGQTWTYHLTAKGQGQTTLRGLPEDQTRELPVSFTLQGDVIWTVAGVSEEGVADLTLQVEKLNVDGQVAGEELTWQWAPPPSPPSQGGDRGEVRLRVKPNGKVIDEKGELPQGWQSLPPALQNIRSLLRQVALTPLPFPDRPVQAGETWEQEHRLELPYLETAPTRLRVSYRWQDFKSVNGQNCASIRSIGEAVREDTNVPFAPWPEHPDRTVELTIDKLRQTLVETSYFAVEAGRLEHRKWEMDFGLTATATVSAPDGGERDLEVIVTWNVSGTLMRRNTVDRIE